MPLLLNQLQATAVRLVTPWTGVWYADVDVALDDTGAVPSGSVSLTVGTSAFLGTVDARASGAFAKTGKVRVLAGGGGWDKPVAPVHVNNPASVLSTMVYAATAAEVGEVVVDVAPKPLGQDYVRAAGPASRVFEGADWYVTPQGITMVGPRTVVPYDPTSVEILSYDPLTRTAELASDAPIAPGTILLDPLRFTGPLTVRDVEQTWTAGGGARATAWCADSKGSRLATALATLVAVKAGVPYLKTYRYRVVLQDPATEKLTLQIVEPDDGVPNAIPFAMWLGVPGFGAKVLPGSEVLVQFVAGDPTQPVVVAFKSGQLPILLEIGLGVSPLALSAGVQTQITALQAQIVAIQAHQAAIGAAPVTATGAVIAALPTFVAAAAAVTSGALAVTGAVPLATSIRVVSD